MAQAAASASRIIGAYIKRLFSSGVEVFEGMGRWASRGTADTFMGRFLIVSDTQEPVNVLQPQARCQTGSRQLLRA